MPRLRLAIALIVGILAGTGCEPTKTVTPAASNGKFFKLGGGNKLQPYSGGPGGSGRYIPVGK